MDELIKIRVNGNGEQSVSAKHLFLFLGFDKSNWKRWSTKNIIKNQFAAEGIDWVGFVNKTNGNETSDYVLSLDFAKRLSMLAKTTQGDQARTYFLQCERDMNKTHELTPLQIAQRLVQLEEERLLNAPKVEYFDQVMQSDSLLATTAIAALLNMSAITLNKRLKESGIQHRVNSRWVLTVKYMGKGFTKDKTVVYKTDDDGTTHTNTTMYWTELGKQFLLTHFKP
jgi:anti-repressor protein